jgi:hypothetical protein
MAKFCHLIGEDLCLNCVKHLVFLFVLMFSHFLIAFPWKMVYRFYYVIYEECFCFEFSFTVTYCIDNRAVCWKKSCSLMHSFLLYVCSEKRKWCAWKRVNLKIKKICYLTVVKEVHTGIVNQIKRCVLMRGWCEDFVH